ncbi:hypothetical protein LCGC14_2752310, partial [marine sediment metagenome]
MEHRDILFAYNGENLFNSCNI